MRICQIDVRVWLGEASRREGRPVTLGSIGAGDLEQILERGFDWVWLRGVWEQDPAVREEARRDALGLEAMRAALPDLELHDIEGSPTTGIRHEIADGLGGEDGFELLREDLARRGIRMFLDFSPRGSSPGDLERVAALADGVALIDDIEASALELATESGAGQRIQEFQEALERVRSIQPRFLVLAEGHLSPLLCLLADHVLDDSLAAALLERDVSRARERLRAGAGLVRYLERPGGQRARALFDGPSLLAASVLAYLSPGVALFQEGQLEGRRCQQDVRLARRRSEPLGGEIGGEAGGELEAFHESLLEIRSRIEDLPGRFIVCPVREAWAENSSHEQLVVSLREGSAGEWILVAVNFGPLGAQGYVDVSPIEPGGRKWLLQDLLSLAMYERGGDDIAARGLYLDLLPWDFNVFEVRPSG